jgi:hypothetical protein
MTLINALSYGIFTKLRAKNIYPNINIPRLHHPELRHPQQSHSHRHENSQQSHPYIRLTHCRLGWQMRRSMRHQPPLRRRFALWNFLQR